jgi:hypothetical protein
VADTGVIYLYRFAEGTTPVRTFLDSYRAHPAGLDHDLHIILKGFPNQQARDAARASFGALAINTMEVDDSGYDIGSYIAAAKSAANRKLLFLNTFSEILADNWLGYFDAAMSRPGVGLVGATGSWQSISSGYEAALWRVLHRPIHYLNQYFGTAASGLDKSAGANGAGAADIRRLLRRIGRISLYPLRLCQFARYPNPHIRTNAFMIERELFLSLRTAPLKTKIDVYKFESGRRSMTKQIMARGLQPVVVDRSGKAYNIPEWKSSSTFWIDLQANLLIGDNQTSSYAKASAQRRKVLKNYAWDSPWSWEMPSRS